MESLKNYQYKIVRYLPDRTTGEFANVGVIFYCKDEKFLRWEMSDHTDRLRIFFSQFKLGGLFSFLDSLQSALEQKRNELQSTLKGELPDQLDQIISSILPADDSAILFTPTESGIDWSCEDAFAQLSSKFIQKDKQFLVHTFFKSYQEILQMQACMSVNRLTVIEPARYTLYVEGSGFSSLGQSSIPNILKALSNAKNPSKSGKSTIREVIIA